MRTLLSVVAAVVVAGLVLAVWIASRSPTNAEAEEIAAVLAPTGSADAPPAYAHCASCHLHDGSGRPDGSIPRLNGQRQAVLESKLHRLRAELVRLPVMQPFARSLTPKEIPQIARYLSALPETEPPTSTESADVLEAGAATYVEHCAACHGANGEGQDGLFASRLCGQYRAYMTRRIDEVRAGTRGEADAVMREVLEGLPAQHLDSVGHERLRRFLGVRGHVRGIRERLCALCITQAAIVGSATNRIGENMVGLHDLAKEGRAALAGAIRVISQGQIAKRETDTSQSLVPGHAEHDVVVPSHVVSSCTSASR